MILRIDKLGFELPPPSDPDPVAAATATVQVPVVQLPWASGASPVLRPHREHRGRGVRDALGLDVVEPDGEVSEHPWGRIAPFQDPDGNDLQLYAPPA